MKWLDNILKSIGHIFADLFSAAEKAWHHLSPELQNALLWSSGVIHLINSNIGQTPEFVLELIKKEFPNIDIAKLEAGLIKIEYDLKIAEDQNSTDILTALGNIQKYLASLQGTTWQALSSILAQSLSIILAPTGTKFASIVQLIEFVYQKFIKKQN